MKKYWISIITVVMGLGMVGQAGLVSLREGLDGYAGTSDTYVRESSAFVNNNNGGGLSMLLGAQVAAQRFSLLRFDLSDYAGMTVTGDATLTLTKVNIGGTADFNFNLYAVSVANADWIEGTKKDALATEGESAWAFKAQGSPAVAWAGSAGLSTPGTDYSETAAGSGTYVQADADGTAYNVTIAASVIQGWIDDPASNGGLLIKAHGVSGSAYAGAFRTSEYWGLSDRPTLTMDVIPEPATSGLVVIGLFGVLLARKMRR